MIEVNLDDSRALLARAQKHFADFNELVHPREGPGLWQITDRRDPRTGEFLYCLHMDRRRLIEAQPILADSATNIASALDHVVAAIARANGHGRLKLLFFPWGSTDKTFEKALTKVEPVIGAKFARVIAAARAKNRHEVHHIEAVKQISNTGKHWELMFAAGAAHAVALHIPGAQQRIFQVPADAFTDSDMFEFYRGTERLPAVPMSMVVGLDIGGLSEDLPNSPDSIFPCSFRFVDGIIATIGEASLDRGTKRQFPKPAAFELHPRRS